ncbi:hypothetical protein PL321_18530 [Caloramator sp. mosi_1]|uniref:hypothetical protein n=1 Tax=Caloramator sp. mosi_1 TaxID=3023090 RepID=UPI00235E7EC2|nr:hypothetical protein [Caloramator sp. mosi_1]WDC84206.1 hypothetical protein PL321_18530 [Caloramator sp. mosi_1]
MIKDLKQMAFKGETNIKLSYILDGIITLLGVDNDFIYKYTYINLLKNISSIESYIISQIEKINHKTLKSH